MGQVWHGVSWGDARPSKQPTASDRPLGLDGDGGGGHFGIEL